MTFDQVITKYFGEYTPESLHYMQLAWNHALDASIGICEDDTTGDIYSIKHNINDLKEPYDV